VRRYRIQVLEKSAPETSVGRLVALRVDHLEVETFLFAETGQLRVVEALIGQCLNQRCGLFDASKSEKDPGPEAHGTDEIRIGCEGFDSRQRSKPRVSRLGVGAAGPVKVAEADVAGGEY